jgi:hypothetical protein
MRFKQKHHCFKSIFLAQNKSLQLQLHGNISFRGELTGEITKPALTAYSILGHYESNDTENEVLHLTRLSEELVTDQ